MEPGTLPTQAGDRGRLWRRWEIPCLKSTPATNKVVLAGLYENQTGLQFLNADMHLGSAKLHRGKLGILDFDDSPGGFPIQDIGVTLFHLARYAEPDQLRQAFRIGYERTRPWPER